MDQSRSGQREENTNLKHQQTLVPSDYLDLALIGSTHALSDGFSTMLVPVMALIVADLSLSPSRAGIILSIFSVASFLFLFPFSVLADHSGWKKYILIAGMSLASLMFFGMRWAFNFPVLLILTFLAGFGNSVYHPCGTALAAERFSKQRAFAISFHSLMGNIGMSIIPVVQAAVAQTAGWRAAISVCTLPAALFLPLIALRYPGRSKRDITTTSTGLWGNIESITKLVLRNRNIVLLAAVYGLKGMGTKVLIGFFPLLATNKFQLNTSTIGLSITLYFAAGIAAKPIMGFLYNRWGVQAALFFPLLMSGAFALAIGLIPEKTILIVLLTLIGATGSISPIVLTAAADMSDRKSLSSAVGFIYTCQGLGFLAPLAGGFMTEFWSIEINYVFSAVLIWSAAPITFLFERKTLAR